MIDNPFSLAILLTVLVFVMWMVYYMLPKNMVPMYYGPYPKDGAPLVSWWQQYTQGGMPNPIIGKGPNGQPLGAYDYLGQAYTGYNMLPGSLVFPEFTDCGCGCGGEKAALNAGMGGAQAMYVGACNKAAAAGSAINPNGTLQKSMPASAVANSPTPIKNFGAAPMFAIHSPDGMCLPDAVRGGRSDCSQGKTSGPSTNPLGFTGSRNFGPAPMNWIHNPAGACQKGAVLGGRSDCSNGNTSGPSTGMGAIAAEMAIAQSQIPGLAQKTDAAFSSMAMLAASGTTLDQAPINAFQDSQMFSPRLALPGGRKNPLGSNEVSSFDHRRR